MSQIKSIAHAMEMIAYKPDADVDLLMDCAALDALAGRFNALRRNQRPGSKAEAIREAKDDEILAAVGPILRRASGARAQTAEGLRAKAKAIHSWQSDAFEDDDGSDLAESLVASILRDLIAM